MKKILSIVLIISMFFVVVACSSATADNSATKEDSLNSFAPITFESTTPNSSVNNQPFFSSGWAQVSYNSIVLRSSSINMTTTPSYVQGSNSNSSINLSIDLIKLQRIVSYIDEIGTINSSNYQSKESYVNYLINAVNNLSDRELTVITNVDVLLNAYMQIQVYKALDSTAMSNGISTASAVNSTTVPSPSTPSTATSTYVNVTSPFRTNNGYYDVTPGTISTQADFGPYVFMADIEHQMSIDAVSAKYCQDLQMQFNYVVKTAGSVDIANRTRCIKFNINYTPCRVTFVAMSASSADPYRRVKLYNNNKEVVATSQYLQTSGSYLNSVTFDINEIGTHYLGCEEGGVNFYYIYVDNLF